MAKLGFRTFNEMIGQMDRLDMRQGDRPLEGQGARLLSRILTKPEAPRTTFAGLLEPRTTASTRRSTNKLIEQAQPALETASRSRSRLPSRTSTAPVGTMLSAKSPSATAMTACRTTPSHQGARHRPASPSAPGSPRASRSSSPARPTTTSARACPAGASSSARRKTPGSTRPRTTSSSATPCSTAPSAARMLLPRRRRRALLRAQLRRQRGGRRRRRPWLRIHDRRHRGLPGPTGRNFAPA
jgi:hypothetical protein